ncbi:hypothetical protein V8C37DRAFT_12907 [Trichoderma ceciliae]
MTGCALFYIQSGVRFITKESEHGAGATCPPNDHLLPSKFMQALRLLCIRRDKITTSTNLPRVGSYMYGLLRTCAGEATATGWTHRLDINLDPFRSSLKLTASQLNNHRGHRRKVPALSIVQAPQGSSQLVHTHDMRAEGHGGQTQWLVSITKYGVQSSTAASYLPCPWPKSVAIRFRNMTLCLSSNSSFVSSCVRHHALWLPLRSTCAD